MCVKVHCEVFEWEISDVTCFLFRPGVVVELIGQALFTVYDGHGKEGDLCAVFCKDTLPGVLSQELRESRTVEDGLKRAFNRTNDQVSRSIVWC